MIVMVILQVSSWLESVVQGKTHTQHKLCTIWFLEHPTSGLSLEKLLKPYGSCLRTLPVAYETNEGSCIGHFLHHCPLPCHCWLQMRWRVLSRCLAGSDRAKGLNKFFLPDSYHLLKWVFPKIGVPQNPQNGWWKEWFQTLFFNGWFGG